MRSMRTWYSLGARFTGGTLGRKGVPNKVPLKRAVSRVNLTSAFSRGNQRSDLQAYMSAGVRLLCNP